MKYNFVTTQKKLELKNRILEQKRNILILYGPSGCGKTHTINEIIKETGKKIIYIVCSKKRVLLMHKDVIGHIDLDAKESIIDFCQLNLFNRNTIIIETRTLISIKELQIDKFKTDNDIHNSLLKNKKDVLGQYGNIDSLSIIKFNKITDAKIKKYCKFVDNIQGNLHRFFIFKRYPKLAQTVILSSTLYHLLGKIFYAKEDDLTTKLEEIKYIMKFYESDKIEDYIFENYLSFYSVKGRNMTSFSETLSFYDCMNVWSFKSFKDDSNYILMLILKIVSDDKLKPNSFFAFSSLKKESTKRNLGFYK